MNGLTRPWVAAGLMAAASFSIGCGGAEKSRAASPAGEAKAAATVAIASARAETVPESLILTGTLQPASRIVVASRVMGRIRRIAVKEGDSVRPGQLIVAIDDADMRAGLAQAESGLAAAQAAEENAARMRDRMKELESRQAATRKNREDAETGYAMAAAGRKQAEAAVESAKAMLAYATVTSPITGVVVMKHAEPGDMAAPGAPILTLETTATMKVEAPLPEKDAASVRPGARVRVDFDAVPGSRDATISEILPSADPATRSFLARVVLDNADGSLRSGTFVRISIDRGERTAMMVPRSALLVRGPLTGLFVREAGSGGAVARLRWVRTGSETGDRIEILSGLSDGEEYVTGPPPDLGDGSPIQAAR